MEPLRLSILGSCSAAPLSNRSPSAQFLNIGHEYFLLDCGEGTQVKLRQHHIGFSRLKHILISHLHGDHFYGLVPLLSTLQLLDRRTPLYLYGPEKLELAIRQQLEITDSRISYPLVFHCINTERKSMIYESKHLTINAFPLRHSIECFGFHFEEKALPRKMLKEKLEEYNIPVAQIRQIKGGADWTDDKGQLIANNELTENSLAPFSFAYCTDTLPIKHLHRYFSKVDLLYHEATFLESEKDRAQKTHHCTASQAGEIATITEAKNLLIGHFSIRYSNFRALKAEAKEQFENTRIAQEGYLFSMDRKTRILEALKENNYS
jgi:ribonuclease Z